MAAVLAAKTSARRRPIYIASLRQYLTAFIKGRESDPIASVKPEHIDEWFAGRNESTSAQASNLGRLSALFSFAMRRGWISRNPCLCVERVTVERTPPPILTVDQSESIIRRCPGCIRPWIVLCLFCGLRPSEAQAMRWENFRCMSGTLVVDAAASKVRRRRIIKLHSSAVRWLAVDAKTEGDMTPPHITLRRHRRRLSDSLGLKWRQDILRHTFASARIAAGTPAAEVAREMGTSERMLGNHYVELVTREDAERFWRITPA